MTADELLEQAQDLASRSPSREAVFLLLGHVHSAVMRGLVGGVTLRRIEDTLGVSAEEGERYSDEVFGVTEKAS